MLIASAGLDWANEESFITTPAMEISERLARLRLSGRHRPDDRVLPAAARDAHTPSRRRLRRVALAAAIIGLLLASGPSFRTLGNLNLVVFFVGVVGAGVFAGVPIGFSFALATFGYLALTTRVPP